jgi:hypothetical protein
MQDQIIGVTGQVPTVASSAQYQGASKLVRADVGRMNDSIFQAVTV